MDTQEATIEDMVTGFRLATYEWLPYLSDMVYALTPTERPGIGTMAVDKYARLYYDPDFVRQLTKEEGTWVILHEVSHLCLRHHARSELIFGKNPPTSSATEDFNIAADLCVYELLEAFNKHMPTKLGQLVTMEWAKSKYPGIVPGSTVEEYFSVIHQQREEDEQGSDDGDQEGSGPDDDDDQDQGDGDGFQGGSAADGIEREYELPPDDNWQGFVEDEILRRIERKISEQEYPGKVAGTFADSIRNHLRPAPDPWKLLRGMVGRVAANSRISPVHTYHRRNRRQHAYPDMPLLKGVKHESPKAVAIVDTSGSMTNEALGKALNAIAQGVRSLGSLRVVYGDTRVCGDVEMSKMPTSFTFTGRGGTDMCPLIEHAINEHDPDLICVVTDGYTPWPADKTKAKLVVALTEEGAVRHLPSWASGHVIIPDCK